MSSPWDAASLQVRHRNWLADTELDLSALPVAPDSAQDSRERGERLVLPGRCRADRAARAARTVRRCRTIRRWVVLALPFAREPAWPDSGSRAESSAAKHEVAGEAQKRRRIESLVDLPAPRQVVLHLLCLLGRTSEKERANHCERAVPQQVPGEIAARHLDRGVRMSSVVKLRGLATSPGRIVDQHRAPVARVLRRDRMVHGGDEDALPGWQGVQHEPTAFGDGEGIERRCGGEPQEKRREARPTPEHDECKAAVLGRHVAANARLEPRDEQADPGERRRESLRIQIGPGASRARAPHEHAERSPRIEADARRRALHCNEAGEQATNADGDRQVTEVEGWRVPYLLQEARELEIEKEVPPRAQESEEQHRCDGRANDAGDDVRPAGERRPALGGGDEYHRREERKSR